MKIHLSQIVVKQAGFSIIELMIGVAISFLVLLAAITTLTGASGTSATTRDLAQLQQQGSTAMRVLGIQIRQVAARNLVVAGADVRIDVTGYTGFNASGVSVSGTNNANNNTDRLNVSYAKQLDSRDCLGEVSTLAGRVDSTFELIGNDLVCTGSTAAGRQIIAEGVEDFQVRYGMKTGTSIRYYDEAPNWNSASTVEVCLQLRSAVLGNDVTGNFINCQGASTPNAGRLHKVFRNTFLIRNQSN